MLDRRYPHAPPSKFNADQRMLFGFTYRQLLIVVAFSIVGLMTFLSLYGKLKSPIVPGICTAVIALAGAAWAFGQIDGDTPEQWLWHFLIYGRTPHYMQHQAMQTPKQAKVQLAVDTSEPAPQNPLVPKEYQDFFMITANVLGGALLAGLTFWLVMGGSDSLTRSWSLLLGRF